MRFEVKYKKKFISCKMQDMTPTPVQLKRKKKIIPASVLFKEWVVTELIDNSKKGHSGFQLE